MNVNPGQDSGRASIEINGVVQARQRDRVLDGVAPARGNV